MPALRQSLKTPGPYLFALLGVVLLACLDVRREPPHQMTAGAWIWMVRSYQKTGRPLLEGRIRCRYVPSCSSYSIEAVERYGIVRGLMVTVERISRCRRDVPLGTKDPLSDDRVR
jgi:putative membrane protein insertion efficiency factor